MNPRNGWQLLTPTLWSRFILPHCSAEPARLRASLFTRSTENMCFLCLHSVSDMLKMLKASRCWSPSSGSPTQRKHTTHLRKDATSPPWHRMHLAVPLGQTCLCYALKLGFLSLCTECVYLRWCGTMFCYAPSFRMLFKLEPVLAAGRHFQHRLMSPLRAVTSQFPPNMELLN